MYLGQNGKYKFFAEEISRCPQAKLDRLSAACERVEQDVWNAVERFSHYLTKQSALIYAKPATNSKSDHHHDHEIVGFALFDLTIKDQSLIVTANECMVMKAHQGYGLPSLFTALLTTHIRKDNQLRKKKRTYQSITFVSSTVSFKLMNAFKRYSLIADSSSFKPDQAISSIARDYLLKENWREINSQSPFFIQAAFPNAVKLISPIPRPAFVPEEFNSIRGDAFLFVCRIKNFVLLKFISKFTLWRFGFRFSKRLIPISRITREQIIYTRSEPKRK